MEGEGYSVLGSIIAGFLGFVVIGMLLLEGIPAMVRMSKEDKEKEKERARQKERAEQEARARRAREEEERRKAAELARRKRVWTEQGLYQKLLEICITKANEFCADMFGGDCEGYSRSFHGVTGSDKKYEIVFEADYDELCCRDRNWGNTRWKYKDLGYELPGGATYDHIRALTLALGDGLKTAFAGNPDVTVNAVVHDYSDGPETEVEFIVKYKPKGQVVTLPD